MTRGKSLFGERLERAPTAFFTAWRQRDDQLIEMHSSTRLGPESEDYQRDGNLPHLTLSHGNTEEKEECHSHLVISVILKQMWQNSLQVLFYKLFCLYVHGREENRPEAAAGCNWTR